MVKKSHGAQVQSVRPAQSTTSPAEERDDSVRDTKVTKQSQTVKRRRVFRKLVAIRKIAVAPSDTQKNRLSVSRGLQVVWAAVKDAQPGS